jgi:hypothetical protein
VQDTADASYVVLLRALDYVFSQGKNQRGALLEAARRGMYNIDDACRSLAQKGLVRASGGDYRRIDLGRVREGYEELRRIVDSTKHLTAECKDPPCAPDGSAIVVRLFMAQGATRLSSESVTVRSVDLEGKVKPPIEKPWWKELLDFFRNMPPELLAVLALLAGGPLPVSSIHLGS